MTVFETPLKQLDTFLQQNLQTAAGNGKVLPEIA
jgi:hypothetical protein